MFPGLMVPPIAPRLPPILPLQVQCRCPASPNWQRNARGRKFYDWARAVNEAQILKSPQGQARIVDAIGRVVYLI
jgi:hypothetical protein